jgi:uncharacterized protein
MIPAYRQHSATVASDVGKLLFFVIIGIAVFLLLGKKRAARPSRPAPSAAKSPEVMVSCAYCGLHIPRSESLPAEGRHYCGDEHRRLDASGGDR